VKKTSCLILALLFSSGVLAQKTYSPTEVQALRLQVKQKDAQLLQVALQQAQQNYQNGIRALADESNKVKKENKWPDSVLMSFNTLEFCEKLDPQGNCVPPEPPQTPEKK